MIKPRVLVYFAFVLLASLAVSQSVFAESKLDKILSDVTFSVNDENTILTVNTDLFVEGHFSTGMQSSGSGYAFTAGRFDCGNGKFLESSTFILGKITDSSGKDILLENVASGVTKLEGKVSFYILNTTSTADMDNGCRTAWTDANTSGQTIVTHDQTEIVQQTKADVTREALVQSMGAGMVAQNPDLVNVYQNDFAAAAVKKSPPPKGCATIGGSLNCGKEAFQLMIGECLVNAKSSSGAGVGVSDLTALIKTKTANCISRNIYGDESESARIVEELDKIDFDKLNKEAEEAVNEALNDLTADPDAATPEQTCPIEGIGWLLCPSISLISKLNDAALGQIKNFLFIKPAVLDSNSGTSQAWSYFRNIANALFVLAFIFIIFSQVTSIGVDNYGVKKALPRLIVGAILINTSYVISQLSVDLSNILGNSIGEMLGNVAGSITHSGTSFESSWAGFAGSALTIGGALVFAYLAIGMPVILGALLAIAMVLIILIARQAIVVLLVAVSPLAFAAWLLPNTIGLYNKWFNLLKAMLLLFPIIAILYGAGDIASSVLMSTAVNSSSGGSVDQGLQLAALGAIALPLGATPMVLKSSLNSLGSIGAKLSGAMNRSSSIMREGVKNRVATSSVGQRFGEFNRANQHRRAMRIARRRSGGISRRLDQSFIGRGMGWDKGSYAALAGIDKAEEEEAANILKYQMNDDIVAGLSSSNKHVQALAAKRLAGSGEWGADRLASYIEGGHDNQCEYGTSLY